MKLRSLIVRALASAAAVAAIAMPLEAQHRPLPAPAGPPVSGPLNMVPQAFDVLHYDARIDLTKAPSPEMTGICEITLWWPGNPDSSLFYFHLRGLKIDSVFYDGVPTTATEHETVESATYHYSITPPPAARTGDTAVIRIVYGGRMERELGGVWGGVTSSGTSLFSMGVGFSNNYVSATQHWLPCYDHPSDKASFRGRFLVKNDKAVASNGLLTVRAQSDTTVWYDWNHSLPCATYLLTFAVDAYVPVEFPGEAPPMVVYSRRPDTAATRITFKLLPQMVRAFEKRFGSYPFEKVGYVNTPIGAMEHQTMISFPRSLSVSRDTLNSTGAHELAHQWFGDLVSPADYRHAWLNESFATFCESVWMEELLGWDAYLNSQRVKGNEYRTRISRSEGIFPLYDFPRASPSSNYPVTIYEKGAVVVGMLRYELGDSVFFGSLRDYLARHGYSTATTADLRNVLEEHAGRSLGWFFDQWIYGKGWPVVDVQVRRGNAGQASVELRQTQADSLPTFDNLPVEIGFRTAAGQTVYRMVRMSGRSMTVALDGLPEFTAVTVNEGPSVRTLMTVTTGISAVPDAPEGGDGTGIFIRPNPASGDAFAVEARGFRDCARIGYELYDAAGHRVASGASDSCLFTIPASGLANGSYLLRCSLGNASHDVRVVVNR